MSIALHIDGVDEALERHRAALDALGPKSAGKAIARALNRAVSAARTEAGRIARRAYTAPADKLFDAIFIRSARPGKLQSTLEISGRPGVSLIHFLATPDHPLPPSQRPADGISVQILRGGPRYAARSHRGGSKSFVIRKPQGGYGIFVRHGRELEMLLGPSPVQALQRQESQERIMARAEEVFSPRLRHEIDHLLAGLGGGR